MTFLSIFSSRWFTAIYVHSENNITNVIESTFSVENNSFGILKVHELKPNGQQVTVTEDNKREYVKLYVNYRFMRGIEQQFLALQKGEISCFWTPLNCLNETNPSNRFLRIDTESTFTSVRWARVGTGDLWHKQYWRKRLEAIYATQALYTWDIASGLVLAGEIYWISGFISLL